MIDPGLVYSTFLGGSNDTFIAEAGLGIAVDGTGSAYVTGNAISTDFPTTAGAFDTSFNGGTWDAFVTKLNPSGAALVYSTYLGGSSADGRYDDFFIEGNGIDVDGSGNAYVTGSTHSTDFPTTPGAYDTSYNGADAFVTKLNAAGSAPVYSTFLGGTGGDIGYAVAVDSAGNAYVTGGTGSTAFPTTPGAADTSYNGGGDAFVTKLNAAGSALDYSTYVGGSMHDGAPGSAAWDAGHGIAIDGAGSAYLTGHTTSKDFPTTPGAFDTANSDAALNAFVTKVNSAGSALAYSTYLGGTFAQAHAIAVDGSGSAYVTGPATASDFPTTPGAFDTSFNNGDGFVTKLNAAGSALAYSTYLHGSGYGIAVDASGSAYVTGLASSSNFPTTPGAFQTNPSGSADSFVTKLSPNGGALAYSTYLGGNGLDYAVAIAVESGNAYVTGFTRSSDFPVTSGASDTSLGGGQDGFVTKLDLIAGPVPPPPPPPPGPPPPARPPPPPPPAPRPQPAPGPRDTELRYDAKKKTFLINVQYVLRNRSCRNPCPARAEIRTRKGRRLFSVGALPGDGRIVLGTRRGIKIPRGRKVYFWIPIKRSALLKAPFYTRRGSRFAETRLRVWLRTPSGEVLTVRDGRIRASIARIRSGALPNLGGIL